jgi:hypothetical protein
MQEKMPKPIYAEQKRETASRGPAGKRARKSRRATPSAAAIPEPPGNTMPINPSIGVGWSSHFERPGLQSLFYRKLRYAYRAPSFFLETMLGDQAHVKFLRFDEALLRDDLDGTSAQLAESADLVYFASHGECHAQGYSLILHDSDWKPCAKGLGTGSLSVAVFDTCDLVNLHDPAWREAWIASAGIHLRLLLGFASPATVATDSTVRGKAFAAKIISGKALGAAWLQAVHDTAYAGADVAVAIGLGSDTSDARWALHEMKLADLPRPRTPEFPTVAVAAVCH